MKTIIVSGASRYSRGKGRNAKAFAQVTFLTGEGSGKRSNTAHPEYKAGYGYVGLNPDPRAIPLNERYEQEFAEAKSELFSAEAALKGLQKRLEVENNLTDEEKLRIYSVADGAEKVKADIEDAIGDAKMEIEATETLVDDAGTKLDIVQRELPLEVAFVGPGLTY